MTFLDCDEVDTGSAHKLMDAINAISQLSYSPTYSKKITIRMKGCQYLIPFYITPPALRRLERGWGRGRMLLTSVKMFDPVGGFLPY